MFATRFHTRGGSHTTTEKQRGFTGHQTSYDCNSLPTPIQVRWFQTGDCLIGKKKRREAQLAKWTTDVADVSEPAPKKRTRKGTKWSREAKARNRQRLLRQRVEKAICGKRHYSETLFSEQLKAEIEAEYQKRLSQNPDYFEGVDVYKDGEDD